QLVARRLRESRGDGERLFQRRVQEGRLPDVGTSDDGNASCSHGGVRRGRVAQVQWVLQVSPAGGDPLEVELLSAVAFCYGPRPKKAPWKPSRKRTSKKKSRVACPRRVP